MNPQLDSLVPLAGLDNASWNFSHQSPRRRHRSLDKEAEWIMCIELMEKNLFMDVR